MKMLFALVAVFAVAGCGQPQFVMPTSPSTSPVAAATTTTPIGAVDLQGRVLRLTNDGTDTRLEIQPEGGTGTATVLASNLLPLRVVRGQYAGVDGLSLPKYLVVGYDVRIQYAPGTGTPRRARAVFWDLTGVPI